MAARASNPHGPTQVPLEHAELPPAFTAGGEASCWLGTDPHRQRVVFRGSRRVMPFPALQLCLIILSAILVADRLRDAPNTRLR